MKFISKLPDDIDINSICNLPTEVPLSINFDNQKIVGTSRIDSEGNMESNVPDEFIKHSVMFDIGIGGNIEERNGGNITKFNLWEVSITFKR